MDTKKVLKKPVKNREFRLIATEYLTEKAIVFMDENGIRKKVDLVEMAIRKYIGIDKK